MHELLSSLHHPAGCELPALSQRQLEILREIYYGKKISEIACELKISENTIKPDLFIKCFQHLPNPVGRVFFKLSRNVDLKFEIKQVLAYAATHGRGGFTTI